MQYLPAFFSVLTAQDIQTVAAVGAILATFLGGLNFVQNLMIQRSMLNQEIKFREWVNGSFMRASEVNARLDSIDGRYEDLSDEVLELRRNGCARISEHLPPPRRETR